MRIYAREIRHFNVLSSLSRNDLSGFAPLSVRFASRSALRVGSAWEV